MRDIEDIRGLVERVKKGLVDLHGDVIKGVLVYGSFARGNATDDSDIDMAVIIDANSNPSEVETSIGDLLFEILLEHGELISLIAVPEDMYRDYDSPFLINARIEGVAV
ncbi:MAG: nucleotidyltransferase domain-containing protein [Actinomycetota bacterium]